MGLPLPSPIDSYGHGFSPSPFSDSHCWQAQSNCPLPKHCRESLDAELWFHGADIKFQQISPEANSNTFEKTLFSQNKISHCTVITDDFLPAVSKGPTSIADITVQSVYGVPELDLYSSCRWDPEGSHRSLDDCSYS